MLSAESGSPYSIGRKGPKLPSRGKCRVLEMVPFNREDIKKLLESVLCKDISPSSVPSPLFKDVGPKTPIPTTTSLVISTDMDEPELMVGSLRELNGMKSFLSSGRGRGFSDCPEADLSEKRSDHKLVLDNVVTEELVDLVTDASLGSPFWCKLIAKLVLDRGVEEFLNINQPLVWLNSAGGPNSQEDVDREFSVTARSSAPQSSLAPVVINLFESMSSAAQIVLKYASILGSTGEFSALLLDSLIPTRNSTTTYHMFSSSDALSSNLQILDSAMDKGLLTYVCADPLTYEFSNEMIWRTVYQLTPARYRMFVCIQ